MCLLGRHALAGAREGRPAALQGGVTLDDVIDGVQWVVARSLVLITASLTCAWQVPAGRFRDSSGLDPFVSVAASRELRRHDPRCSLDRDRHWQVLDRSLTPRSYTTLYETVK